MFLYTMPALVVMYLPTSYIFALFAPWVLSDVLDYGLYPFCVQGLFLCCHDQCLCSVPERSLLQPQENCLDISRSLYLLVVHSMQGLVPP